MRSFLWLVVAVVFVAADLSAADLSQADAFFRGGKYAEARSAYEALLPNLAGEAWDRAAYGVGYCLERTHERERAVAAYRRVATNESASVRYRAMARLQAGGCLSLMGRLEEARAELAAISDLPGAESATVGDSLLVLGSVYHKLGDTAKAVSTLAGIETVPGLPAHTVAESWSRRGSLLLGERKYREAAEAYRRVLTVGEVDARHKAVAEGALEELDLLQAGDQPFYIKPYVSQVTVSNATVRWVALGGLPPGIVTLTGPEARHATFLAATSAIPAAACVLHTASLTGLQAGVRYACRVDCGTGNVECAFGTPPPAGTAVSFAVLGDTQAAPDLHAAVARAIAADAPDFVVHVGDLTDLGSQWRRWRSELFDPGWPYFGRCLFRPAVGNHDGGPFFRLLFGLQDGFTYSFTYGDVHVLVLDSYWSGSRRARMLEWARQDLAASAAPWKVAVLHVPMVAVGLRAEHRWFGEKDFLPLMEDTGVDLVFSGHIPLYRRFLPIGKPGHKPVIHVTSGGGGPVGAPYPSPLMIAGSGVCHHALVRVDGHRLELTAKQPDGTVIDRLVLVKNNNRYQDEIMTQAVDPDLAARIQYIYHELVTDPGFALAAGFDRRPEPGAKVKLVIDLRRLPRGGMKPEMLPPETELILKSRPGCAWEMPEQAQSMQQGKLFFEVAAPHDLVPGDGRFQPALDVIMSLRVNGRVFEPYACPVASGSDAVLKGHDEIRAAVQKR